MAALPMITIEELNAIDTPERCELHHGDIPVTAPALKHTVIQRRLRRLLERLLGQ
jgi:hypothetical protein